MVGETGCGKSVTALSIMNLISETQGAVVDGEIRLHDIDLSSTQKLTCTIKETSSGPALKVHRRFVKKNSRLMKEIRGDAMSMIFQEPMTTLNPILTIKKQFEDALFVHHVNTLATRIMARKMISREQLTGIIEHAFTSASSDYLEQFVADHPELSAIREQVDYILNRRDINSFRKKQMISELYSEDRTVTRWLQALSERKWRRVPIRLPREIRAEAKRLIVELLTKVNIPDAEKVINQYPHELSGGMRQRVIIAIALSSSPSLLIADEPTTALDVTIQAQILDIIKELKRAGNTSVLFITHDLGVISEITDRVAVMYAGSIVETAKTGAIFNDPKHPYTTGLLDSIPPFERKKERLKSIPGSVPNPLNRLEGCKFHPRCSFAKEICSRQIPRMTDVGDGHLVACWLYE